MRLEVFLGPNSGRISIALALCYEFSLIIPHERQAQQFEFTVQLGCALEHGPRHTHRDMFACFAHTHTHWLPWQEILAPIVYSIYIACLPRNNLELPHFRKGTLSIFRAIC